MSHLVDSDSPDQTPEFTRMIEAGLSRRSFLSAVGAGSAAMFLGASASAEEIPTSETLELIGFHSIPASTADSVNVPPGYKAEVLISWGDRMFSDSPKFDQRASAQEQELQFGDNCDGMSFFPLDENRAVLAINNEYTNHEYLFAHGKHPLSADDVRKCQAAHGVSVVEIERVGKSWKVNRNSSLNRRITATTPMEITGPAAGNSLLKTAADPKGRAALGTLNNCANGETPWGTYLTCEENFHRYFGSNESVDLGENYQIYDISGGKTINAWQEHDERFDLAKHANEPHRFGWVVEIDPFDPQSTPKKRTALGRFKHENAELVVNRDGRIVVYMGDDEKGAHIYKFVSKGKYNPNEPQQNRDLLDEGTLYVAKFEGKGEKLKGTGRWIELTWGKNNLTPENGFSDPGSVYVFARRAAKIVGATTMDRPEWVAVHPDSQHVFCTLTNNSLRGVDADQPLDEANPRAKNLFGHIIRWRAPNGNHASDRIDWDLFLLAGNPMVHRGSPLEGSPNIDSENMFNSPDGLGFDAAGRMWILTDGDYSNSGDFAGMGNNQMLCADPRSGEVRRFLTGPIACEITGLAFSPDSKTMFVGVQHPGEDNQPSHFPDGGDSVPRSSVVIVTRDDGGVIGAK